ncbi:MAG: hypothetical protein JXB15_08230 [Anaerolineales bacterium]|nr:hypothetical protein [Anaerolineales bacterium]
MKLIKFFLPIVIALGLVWWGAQAAQAGQTPAGDMSPENGIVSFDLVDPDEAVQLVQSDRENITLELRLPEFRFEPGSADGRACQKLVVDGFPWTDQAGQPMLPVHGAMLGVPLESEPQLTVLQAVPVRLEGRYDLCPLGQPVYERDDDGRPIYQGEIFQRDPAAYSQDSFSPLSPAEVTLTGMLRSQQVALVRFQPFQYNPVTGELRYFRTIRVRLDLNGVEHRAGISDGSIVDEGPFEQTLSQALLNYDTARDWRRVESASVVHSASKVMADPSYMIKVNQTGIYQVGYADLVAAGIDPATIVTGTLQLFNQGNEAALLWLGDSDADFEAGESFLFYGQSLDLKYTNVNAYYLTWGITNGKRMAALDGTLSGSAVVPAAFLNVQHAESNFRYVSDAPNGPQKDVWFWNNVRALSAPASREFITSLANISNSSSLTATVEVMIKGYSATSTNPAIPAYQHSRVYINNFSIDDSDGWAPTADLWFTATISQTKLVNGNNALKVELPRDGTIATNYVFFNWYELKYWDTYVADSDPFIFAGELDGSPTTWEYRVTKLATDQLEAFVITDPLDPQVVTNASIDLLGDGYRYRFEHSFSERQEYLLQSVSKRLKPLAIVEDTPSDLKATTNKASYIIITHGDFYTATELLAAYRDSPDFPVMRVDVQDIYDEFNHGVVDVQAIHDFLKHTYDNWQKPAPSYVLLVGDGHFDPRDYYLVGEPNYIPAYLEQVDPFLGETATDNRFVTVSGSDVLPDMHIGRFPVQTAQQTTDMINKVLAYEGTPVETGWNRAVAFIADDPDDAGNFRIYSNDIADYYMAGYDVQKIYYGVPGDPDATHTSQAAAQAAILAAINNGAFIIHYNGHASIHDWASPVLFSKNDIPSLTNIGKLPFWTPMTCLEGSFDYPSPPGINNSSLSEMLVREASKGAIASFAPTGLGVASGHEYLDHGLFKALFMQGASQVGPATTASKLYLAAKSGGGHLDLLDTYLVLGDPAVRLHKLNVYYLLRILKFW